MPTPGNRRREPGHARRRRLDDGLQGERPRDQVGDFLDFVLQRGERARFSREDNLLPVTTPPPGRCRVRPGQRPQAFLDSCATSELYPVGNTSWATVNAAVKKEIGKAVAPNGSPAGVLGGLQATATRAQTAG
ncbi:hypothetical protein GCM10023238_29290 [Streptomyces heliomycini]